MDKATFIKFAPPFYAMAILDFLLTKESEALIEEIKGHYSVWNDTFGEQETFFPLDHVIEIALKWLQENKFIVISSTYFAPRVIKLDDVYNDVLSTLGFVFEEQPVVRDYLKFRGRAGWLTSALKNIEIEHGRLNMRPEDFEDVAQEIEWAPIALDRDDPQLTEVIDKLDDVVDQVRSSNGVTASNPGFQQYVLVRLRGAAETLKTARETTRAYLRTFVGQPLSELANRYGPSAVGAAADLAAAALKEWLRKRGVTFLDDIFR